MPSSKPEFDERLSRLKSELENQARAVRVMIETAVDAAFDRDVEKASRVLAMDQEIDREDVRIERSSVQLLHEAAAHSVALDPHDVRLVLTIVKVNNELERIADCAVVIAEKTPVLLTFGASLPTRFRVMANSIIGIMQTTAIAFGQMDRIAAELVLASDDATEAFKQELLKTTLEQLMRGQHTIEHALALQIIAANLGRMADYCTNIAEQVIYVSTGKVVRHEGDRWTKPQEV